MKKIILLLAFCLSVGNLFAQDANADKLREEGDAAMTAKNYPEVVAKYSEYLKLTNYEDESRIFNCAFAAYNAKKILHSQFRSQSPGVQCRTVVLLIRLENFPILIQAKGFA